MNVRYCDVCKMIIKENKKEETYLDKEKKEYTEPSPYLRYSFAASIVALPSNIPELKPYVFNKELCDNCIKSFYETIAEWERLRFEQTKSLFIKKLENI